jgi:hypothetical protein
VLQLRFGRPLLHIAGEDLHRFAKRSPGHLGLYGGADGKAPPPSAGRKSASAPRR